MRGMNRCWVVQRLCALFVPCGESCNGALAQVSQKDLYEAGKLATGAAETALQDKEKPTQPMNPDCSVTYILERSMGECARKATPGGVCPGKDYSDMCISDSINTPRELG